ncbi:MAG: nucleotidyl transferase AbiEii/AbiGii toxin family protein [Bacteroidota bacterium]
MLYWNTVIPLLKDALCLVSASNLFKPFRLVGGTSLSLQLGHRQSIDIDLFTDAGYGTIDYMVIDAFLRSQFAYVSAVATDLIGPGHSYYIGNSETDCVKLDLYYTDAYIRPERETEGLCLADIEDIIAMKMDVIQRTGRKKDFWDLHELLSRYNIEQMIAFHNERYPYGHDEDTIKDNLTNFSLADEEFDPICFRGKYWELIKLDFFEITTSF